MNEEFDKLLALLAEQKEDYTFQIAAARQLITRAKEIMDSPYPANVYLDQGEDNGIYGGGITSYTLAEISELAKDQEFFLMVPVVEKRRVSCVTTLTCIPDNSHRVGDITFWDEKYSVVPCDEAHTKPTTMWKCPRCLHIFPLDSHPKDLTGMKDRLRKELRHPQPSPKIDVGGACFICQREVL